MAIDEDKVGFSCDSEEFRVNTARLAQFAAALGVDAGPVAEGRVAHPIFAHVPVTQSMVETFRAAVPGFAFHGEHDFHFHRVIEPGQRLYTLSALQCIRQTKAGAALVVRSDLATGDGETVCVQYTTNLVPRATLASDRGEPAPALPDIAALREGEPVETVVAICDDLARRYSDASRDYSPYTMRHDAAERIGLPHPILHGICTLGLAVEPLLAAAGAGVEQMKRLACRFTHPLYLTGGRRITVRHWRSSGMEAFEIVDDEGNQIVRNGYAEFRS